MAEPTPLNPELSRLLDLATSRAKRLGHGQVLAGHLALALSDVAPDLVDQEFHPDFTDVVNRSLADVARSFTTPKPDPDVVQLLDDVSRSGAGLPGLAAALRELLAQHAAAQLSDQERGKPRGGSETGPPAEPAVAPGPQAGTQATGRPEKGASGLIEQIQSFAELAPGTAALPSRSGLVGRIAALLNARTPQTALVVAPQGAGRSTLAQGLAAGLETLPETVALRAMPVVRLRPERLIASGDPAAGLSAALRATRGKAVLFIDDVDVLAWLSYSGPGFGLLRVLRSALDNPDFRAVLTIEEASLDQLRGADIELFEELDVLRMEPLVGPELLDVARQQADQLAAHHQVEIPADVVSAAVAPPKQADSVAHPGLAVMRLDRAASAAALRADRVARAGDLGFAAEGQQYVSFDAAAAGGRLREAVFGQDEAIERVTRRLSVTRAALDLRPERPDGVFLLAGPTGTGKTHFALNLATEVFGSQNAVIRVDCSELSDPEAVTKLIGPPPGYLGSKDPESWLTTKVRRRPQSVLLLDEVEKAHPVIWNTFLQVFDAGRLTDSQGRSADFRDVVIVMTTNIGSEAFATRNQVGFGGSADADRVADAQVMTELRRQMRPELLNRMDEIVVFHPLSPETVQEVARLRLADAITRLAARGWEVDVEPGILDLLVAKGYSREYGARPMLRAIEELLLAGMSSRPPGRYRVVRDGDLARVEPLGQG